MTIDIASLLAGVSFTAIAGWIGMAISLRKDERVIQIDQVTKARAAWRENMRALTSDIVSEYYDKEKSAKNVAVLRAKLVTTINGKYDRHDKEIIAHFDRLFTGASKDIEIFVDRVALLLKHDWERVKWESAPVYTKMFTRWSCKQKMWRKDDYREVVSGSDNA